MTSNLGPLGGFLAHLVRFTGWRAAGVIGLMIAAALSEGLGLLLLIPMLAIVGLGTEGETNGLALAIDEFAAQFNITLSLNFIVLVFIALITVRQALVYLSMRMTEETRISYVASLRKELFAALGETRWGILKGGRFAHLGQVFYMDSWRVGDLALNLFKIISTAAIITVNLAVAFILSPMLALFVLIGLVTLMLLFSGQIGSSKEKGGRVTGANREFYKIVENFLDNLRVAKLSGAEVEMQRRFDDTIDGLGAEMSGFLKASVGMRVALQLAAATGLAVFVLIAVNGFGTRGSELIVMIFITTRLIPHFSSLNQYAHHIYYHLPAFATARTALEDCYKYRETRAVDKAIDLPRATIEVDQATVYALDDPGKALLKDVSLVLQVGEVVAVEGPSGAGKSTLADVFSGLMHVDSGLLRLDGRSLTADRLKHWRRHVGYVPQSAALLRDTLRENLTWLLSRDPSPEELASVLSCTAIDAKVASMPDGLDTQVDRREGKLSGGERQRIALARELLREPSLLILDEATNALDSDTERLVVTGIRETYPSMTILLIAHRPKTLHLADRVVRMDGGCLLTDDAPAAVASEFAQAIRRRQRA